MRGTRHKEAGQANSQAKGWGVKHTLLTSDPRARRTMVPLICSLCPDPWLPGVARAFFPHLSEEIIFGVFGSTRPPPFSRLSLRAPYTGVPWAQGPG